MSVNRDLLEDRLQEYEEQLRGINAYLKELKAVTDKHDTDEAQFAEDVLEAEHNIKFFQSEIAAIKAELGGWGGTHALLCRLKQPGVMTIGIGVISFVAGALLGSTLKSGGGHRRGR